MRTIIAAAAASTQRPFARFVQALSGSAGLRARRPVRARAALATDGLSDHLVADLGLAPVARPTDSRAYLAAPPRRSRSRGQAVPEIDFAYYAALTQRNG